MYYAYSLQDGERYGFSTAPLYAQMAKPPSQQSIRIEHVPLADAQRNPYEAWRQRSG